MFWISLGLGALVVIGVAALWLGWGRSSSWQEVTGYDQFSDPQREALWQSQQAFEASGCQLRWWGHATLTLEWGGTTLVFDPVTAGRIKVAPRRFDDLQLADGASFDAVLLTHAHMDHMDLGTLSRLAPSRLLLPAGSERFLNEKVSTRHTIELVRLGERVEVGRLGVTPVEAMHGGWRYPWQRGLFACGYVVDYQGQSIYVAGDTALGDHFESIGKRYHPIAAVLPIGAYSPEFFLRIRHLNPEEAWAAAEMLGGPIIVPYHFGTYRLSLESMDAPLARFSREAARRGAKWFLPVMRSSVK